MRCIPAPGILVLLAFGFVAAGSRGDCPDTNTNTNAELAHKIDSCVNQAIADRSIPGAVVMVGRGDQVIIAQAYGQRAVVPEMEEMTLDTIFDMASLTKPVATATSIMMLVDEKKLRLDDRLGAILPEFAEGGKGEITIEQLLRHRSGLIADNPIKDYQHGVDEAWARLAKLDLASPRGERFLYSDVNFIILGHIVERVSGMTLDEFTQRRIFDPLSMSDTRFRRRSGNAQKAPTDDHARIAPTESVDGEMRRGTVHDPRSFLLDGVAGHAGLFSSALDLGKFARMLLSEGRASSGKVLLKPETVQLMTSAADTPARQRRGLGWDVDTPFSSPRGKGFGDQSYGHTGFTGTSLWIDPETDSYVILLTSRLHPDGKAASPSRLRSEIATVVAESFKGQIEAKNPDESPRP